MGCTRTCLGLPLCFCVFSIIGCSGDVESKSMPFFSDNDIRTLRLSILWCGPQDKPAPAVTFVVSKEHYRDSHVVNFFKPTVMLSIAQARAVLNVLSPIYENSRQSQDYRGYSVKIESDKQQISFPLGASREDDAIALRKISETLREADEGAITLMIAYVSN